MVVSTMVIGSMDSHMVSERRPYLMAPPMKDDGLKERLEAMASRFSRMELYSKVNGRSQSSSKESASSQMDRSLMVNGLTESQRVSASSHGQTVAAMRVNGSKESQSEKE